MSVKKSQINWKDTNLALIGSDLERKIKEASSKGEVQWTGIGKEAKLFVWRIEQFRVVSWPQSKYGKFHTGDSYVVLNSYKADSTTNKLSHDLHIWIGEESTQDEYGTAAYKMVEADDYLGGAAIEHREVQYQESDVFRRYFGDQLTYLSGGVASGFKHVEPNEVEPHLYMVKGTKRGIALTQKDVRRDQMNSGDTFILHAGNSIWVWQGKFSNPEERAKGMEVARTFVTGSNVVVLDEGGNDGEEEAAEFWKYMPKKVSTMGIFRKSLKVKEADEKDLKVKSFQPVLYRLPDDGYGTMKMMAKAKLVALGSGSPTMRFKRRDLEEDHGYLVDTGFEVYIWQGKKVDRNVRIGTLPLAQHYFTKYRRPQMAVTIVKDGFENLGFQNYFYDAPESGCSCAIM